MLNFTTEGRIQFKLPLVEVPITFYAKRGPETKTQAIADTLILEPDFHRIMITWRASLPLRRGIAEVAETVVGRMTPAWYRARKLGKEWYSSLSHAVNARKQEEVDR